MNFIRFETKQVNGVKWQRGHLIVAIVLLHEARLTNDVMLRLLVVVVYMLLSVGKVGGVAGPLAMVLGVLGVEALAYSFQNEFTCRG